MKQPPSPLLSDVNSITEPEIDRQVLRYLSLPLDYAPKPSAAPLDFLRQHLSNLPPSLLQSQFAPLLSPLARTVLPAIRNRRLAYHSSAPGIFAFPTARNQWVNIWDEIAPASVLRENWRDQATRGGKDEESWAEGSFLGDKEVVGDRKRLGKLLGVYEEERIGDEERQKRRKRLQERSVKMSEELHTQQADEEDSEEESEASSEEEAEPVNNQHLKRAFERILKERFIDGRLDNMDYDSVDWDDRWDIQSRDDEDKWFDEEDEE